MVASIVLFRSCFIVSLEKSMHGDFNARKRRIREIDAALSFFETTDCVCPEAVVNRVDEWRGDVFTLDFPEQLTDFISEEGENVVVGGVAASTSSSFRCFFIPFALLRRIQPDVVVGFLCLLKI